jgi:hypothetical protein
MLATFLRRFRRHRYTISWNRLHVRVDVETQVSDEERLESDLMALGLVPPTLDALGRHLHAIGQERGLVVSYDRDIVHDRLRGKKVIRVRMARP